MSRIVITMSRTIFFRPLAHAPEELQREAKEDARRAIPAFCLTEDDIREKFAQGEQWDELSADVQQEAVQLLLDAGEYCDLKHKVAASAGICFKNTAASLCFQSIPPRWSSGRQMQSSLIFTRISLRVPGKPEGRLARGRRCCWRHSP